MIIEEKKQLHFEGRYLHERLRQQGALCRRRKLERRFHKYELPLFQGHQRCLGKILRNEFEGHN